MPDLLARAAELVAIASVSHDEARITDHLEAQLRQAVHLHVVRLGDNLVARTELGRSRRVILAGHTDTVPPDGNAQPRIDGDVLYGVGSADMKGGLAVMSDLASTLASPGVDVTYVFYAAEEVAAEHNGLGLLFDERPDLLAGDIAILGEPTSAAIEAGCQGSMRAVVTFRGARAHPARPWMGRNAIHALGPVLDRIAAYEARRPVIEGCEFREAVQAVFVEGGVAGNVVPDVARLTVNHRFAPDRSPGQAEAQLREIVGSCDEFEVADLAPAAYPATGHPLIQRLISDHGLEVRAKLGWTDVARFGAHGIPAVNFGPGDATIAHTAGECVDRREIERVHAALTALLTTE